MTSCVFLLWNDGRVTEGDKPLSACRYFNALGSSQRIVARIRPKMPVPASQFTKSEIAVLEEQKGGPIDWSAATYSGYFPPRDVIAEEDGA